MEIEKVSTPLEFENVTKGMLALDQCVTDSGLAHTDDSRDQLLLAAAIIYCAHKLEQLDRTIGNLNIGGS